MEDGTAGGIEAAVGSAERDPLMADRGGAGRRCEGGKGRSEGRGGGGGEVEGGGGGLDNTGIREAIRIEEARDSTDEVDDFGAGAEAGAGWTSTVASVGRFESLADGCLNLAAIISRRSCRRADARCLAF